MKMIPHLCFGTKKMVEYRAERPHQVKPNIVDRTYDANKNVEYLICDQNKQWCPKRYNELYGAPEGEVKPKFYKGKNPNGQLLENL